MVNSYNSYVFTNIFTKTYASFDRLTNIFYGKTTTNNDLEDLKKDLKKLIKEHEKYKENEEIFDKLSNQISNFKNGISHRKKLITAMEDVAKYIPERDGWYNFNTAETKDNIYDLRNKIIHNGNIISVKREDLVALEKLQWLTFGLQLKEMNVEFSDIEDILNCIFGVG
jgi:regulator of replication initiation timing